MRRLWLGIGLLSILIGHLGCEKDKKFLRPPKPPEAFNTPPDDPRYTNLPTIPKEYLNEDPFAAKGGGDPSGSGGVGSNGKGGRPGM